MIKFMLGLPFSYRQRRLAAGRPPIGKEQFVSMVSVDDADRLVAERIWEALVAARVYEALTPYPDDSLEHVYGVAEEERDEDLVLSILEQLDIPIPDQNSTMQFGLVDSPRRVVEFVRECRRRIRA